MSRYTGETECPGCGRPGSEVPRNYAKEVCHECKTALRYGCNVVENDDGRNCRIFLDGYSAKALTWNAGEQRERTGKPPYISGMNEKEGSSKDLQLALIDFIETLHIGSRPNEMAKIRTQDVSRSSGYTIPYNQGKMFFKFWDALARYTKRLQKKSFMDGKDLLKGLNDGSHTLKDFEDSIKRMEDR